MLGLQDLEYQYPRGGFRLGPLTAQWKPGMVALLGPNGAGKSTLIKLVTGALRPTAGRITGGGVALGYIPQQAGWPGHFTVRDFLRYSAWLHAVPRRERADAVDAAAAALDLTEQLSKRLKALSGGQRRRAVVAFGLVHNPPLLVLDEPSTGLDPRHRVALRETLARLAVDRTVLVATHLVEDVESAARWVTVVDEGRIVLDSAMNDLPLGDAGRSPLESAYLRVTS